MYPQLAAWRCSLVPSQHKHNPVPLRLPEGDRSWLLTYAEATGQPVNAVLVAALAEYRIRHGGNTTGGSTMPVSPPVNGDTTRSGDTTRERTPPRPELKHEPSPEPVRKRKPEPAARSCTHKRVTSSKGGKCHDCGDWVPASS